MICFQIEDCLRAEYKIIFSCSQTIQKILCDTCMKSKLDVLSRVRFQETGSQTGNVFDSKRPEHPDADQTFAPCISVECCDSFIQSRQRVFRTGEKFFSESCQGCISSVFFQTAGSPALFPAVRSRGSDLAVKCKAVLLLLFFFKILSLEKVHSYCEQ